MTREQFMQSSRRVALYTAFGMWLMGMGFMVSSGMLLWWARPLITAFGQLLRNQYQDEGVVGLIGGLVLKQAKIPMLAGPSIPGR